MYMFSSLFYSNSVRLQLQQHLSGRRRSVCTETHFHPIIHARWVPLFSPLEPVFSFLAFLDGSRPISYMSLTNTESCFCLFVFIAFLVGSQFVTWAASSLLSRASHVFLGLLESLTELTGNKQKCVASLHV